MAAVKKGDFVELDYTGRIKDSGMVFDTTDVELAKKEELGRTMLGPITVCVGEGHVLPGLDRALGGKEFGAEFTISLAPEEAFGKKSAKLVQLIPLSKFTSQGVRPMVGLPVNVDGHRGLIKTVTGGRVLVDFNHPLSGMQVEYTAKVLRKVDDDKEKLTALLSMQLNVAGLKLDYKDGEATVTSLALPGEIADRICADAKKLIPSLTKLRFVGPAKDAKDAHEHAPHEGHIHHDHDGHDHGHDHSHQH